MSKRWLFPEYNPEAAAALARSASLPPLIAGLLLARGIQTAAEATQFFHPHMDHLLDPFSMLGMDRAVARIQAAVAGKETILIYGDYDVDGTTAVVLLKTAIEMTGGAVRFHVPHRLREGYGMQAEVLRTAQAEGVRLVISVDTGIRAFAAAEAAKALGLDLIVTDHHLPETTHGLPRALAILNPNQSGCPYACKHICGAGVAFKLSQALLQASSLDQERVRTKLLPSFLKLLAIATVADAVPLAGENRVFVALGLEELRRPIGVGLRALLAAAKLDPSQRNLTTTDIGFRLAPRINAAGRMDVASEVVELFTTRDPERARELAQKLEQLNTDRRATEAAALDHIVKLLEGDRLREARCIVVDGDGWHRGVIGILASRIVDQTGKPAIVIAHEDGEAYGSGRSVAGFHLLNAIESCRELFTRFGGHAHAVGFSLPSSSVETLRSRLLDHAAVHLQEDSLGSPLQCQALLPLDEITPELYAWLRQLEPLGMGNAEPVFVARNVRLTAAPRLLKDQHVRLRVAQGPGGTAFAAVGWRWAERVTSMGLRQESEVDLAYRLRRNEHPDFGGLELEIADMTRLA